MHFFNSLYATCKHQTLCIIFFWRKKTYIQYCISKVLICKKKFKHSISSKLYRPWLWATVALAWMNLPLVFHIIKVSINNICVVFLIVRFPAFHSLVLFFNICKLGVGVHFFQKYISLNKCSDSYPVWHAFP